MPEYDYDLIVIGSGPAGQRAAIQAAKLDKRVAIVERKTVVGGVCINTGTIPSKTLREAVLHLSGYRERGLYEGRQDRLQLARPLSLGLFEHAQPLPAHVVHAAAEHLVDQVFLGAEVVVDRGDVDRRQAGDLAQRGARESVLGEQFLRRESARDDVLLEGILHERFDHVPIRFESIRQRISDDLFHAQQQRIVDPVHV